MRTVRQHDPSLGGGLQLRLLGPVELVAGGRALDCGPARQRTVLAALGVDAGRLVPQDALIARVWGDAPPAGVRSGLYSYVTRLRRVLHAAGAPGPAAGLTGGWAGTTRDLLEQRRVDAVLGWARAHLDAGRPGTVIGALRDLLPGHRLVEPLAARLIEALYADGRAAEALDCYAGVRAHLVAELGAEPGAELRQLHAAILRGDPPPGTPGRCRPVSGRPLRRPRPRCLSRSPSWPAAPGPGPAAAGTR